MNGSPSHSNFNGRSLRADERGEPLHEWSKAADEWTL